MFNTKKNIFNVIKENTNENLDDYIIYDGYVLNSQYLVNSGFESSKLSTNDFLYPIYIPGKHPVIDSEGKDIDIFNINDSTSCFYTTGNYYELCILDQFNNTKSPTVGDPVRIYYNKSKNKTYSIGYFKIYGTNVINSSNSKDINQNSTNVDTSKTSITNAYTKINYTKISPLSFNILFGGIIGKIIVYKYNYLSKNLYSIAYKESIVNPYAIGDAITNTSAGSQGLFQINMNNRTSTDLQNFLTTGFNYINGNKKLPNIYTVNSFNNSLDSTKGIDPDVQIVAYIGYLSINNALDVLITDPITNGNIFYIFAKAQRFNTGYADYENTVNMAYNSIESEYTSYYTQLKTIIDPKILAKTTNGLDQPYKDLVTYLM
jgi:hypothetical protein